MNEVKKNLKPNNDKLYWDIWTDACELATEKAIEHQPKMIKWVDGEGNTYEHDLCGFARVVLSDGRSSFAKWAKKNVGFDGGYYGVQKSVDAFGQSYERKEVFAQVVASELNKNGINAWCQSNLD